MPHTHRHRSSHPDADRHCGNHRSASSSERSAATKAPSSTGPAARHDRQRPDLPGAASSGKNAAALCVMFAFLGLGIVAVAEIIARTTGEPIHPAFTFLAGAGTLAALGTAVYAQTTQLRHWSRRVKRRLLIGLPVALLNALMVTDAFFDKYKPLDAPAPDKPDASARRTSANTLPEDNALIKPGWYGEFQQNQILLVFSSFEDHAAETRLFCRRLSKPVSYARLSLINLGAPVPAVLQSLQVGLRLDSGEEVQSLAVKPLLEKSAGANTDLIQLLTVPATLVAGAMLPDIPVCQETNFPWAHVTAVTVSLNSGILSIPGRMMTANEKQAMLERAVGNRPPGGTNITAEAWFKNL